MSAESAGSATGSTSAVPLVLLGHGTRSESGRRVVEEIAAQVRKRLPEVPVRLGYLDVIEPTAEQVLDGLDEAVIVPLLMTAGYHIDVDLRQVIGDRSGIVVTPVFSEAADLASIAAERLAQLEADSLGRKAGTEIDHVLLLGAGSSVASACRQVERTAAALAARLGRPVRHAFLSAAEPDARTVVAELLADGGTVAVLPLLLAPGHFHTQAEKLADFEPERVLVADPLGADLRLAGSVLNSYAGARRSTDAVVSDRK